MVPTSQTAVKWPGPSSHLQGLFMQARKACDMLPPTCTTHHYHDGVCCNCSAVGGPLPLHMATPKTQKARGVKALAAMGYKVPAARLVASDQDMQALLTEARTKPLFARPCPPTPRPGFVDSRICHNDMDYAAVWAEARKADPAAELLLMPPISATRNYVICPGLMTIGPGHDGATAGKHAVGFPIVGEDPMLAKHHADLGIAPGEVPHVELVVDKMGGAHPWWTQCRSGPPHPGGGPDYIPTDVNVQNVVIPCDDFLEWETKVKAGFAPGTVIYGKGHTLGSHAALHCLAHQVPFMTSREPVIGEVLKATPALPSYDIGSLLSGLAFGMTKDLYSHHDGFDITTILYGLHNAPALRGPDSWWLGYAAALMLRFGMRASDVELNINHAVHSLWGKGYGGQYHNSKMWFDSTPDPAALYFSQEQVCTRQFYTDLTVGGIGGIKWAWCSQTMRPLAMAIHHLAKAGVPDDKCCDVESLCQALIQALNSAINQAHNGGYWMNKFGGSQHTFEQACKGDWAVWVSVAPRLMEVREEQAHITPVRKQHMKACLHDWATVTPPPAYVPVIQSATLTANNPIYSAYDTLTIHWEGRALETVYVNVNHSKVVDTNDTDVPVTWVTHHTPKAWAWTFECKGHPLTLHPVATFTGKGGIRIPRTRQ